MGKRYSDAGKKMAIDGYFELGSFTLVVKELGFPSVPTLLDWAKTDLRWDKPELHYKRSTYEMRCACVAAYLDGVESLGSIAETYGTSACQISRWTTSYLKSGPSALRPNSRKGVAMARQNDKVRPNLTPETAEIADDELRDYCEQLKFENDVLRAELDLFAKKAQASARRSSRTQRGQS